MNLPKELQELMAQGKIVLTGSNETPADDRRATFDIPGLNATEKGQYGPEPVWYEMEWFEQDNMCYVEKNHRFTGPAEAFDGDPDGFQAWLDEQLEEAKDGSA